IPIFSLSIFHTPLHHGVIYSLIPCSSTYPLLPSACTSSVLDIFTSNFIFMLDSIINSAYSFS
ncbi:hypothetical protein L9F63_021514, partial [Diploptera punctata]